MANRLVSNMYIIDSASTTSPLPYGLVSSVTSTWGVATTANVGKMWVTGVAVWFSDTTGAIQFALGNTANVVLSYKATGSGNFITSPTPQVDHWEPTTWNGVFIPLLTACTATLILV